MANHVYLAMNYWLFPISYSLNILTCLRGSLP